VSAPTSTDVFAARGGHGPRPSLTARERIGAVAGYLVLVYRRTLRGTIISTFLSPLFFLLAMGIGLGSLIDERTGGLDGVPYLQFVVPAIVAMQTMWLAMFEATYPVMDYIKWSKLYDSMLATPLRVRDIMVGHIGAITGRLVVATAVFMLVASPFGGFATWGALWCLPIAVLTGLAFTVPIFAFTATQETEDGFNILFRLVATPLMLFSGTFFPIDQLPGWMQPFAWVTPLWHGVESARMVALGAVDLPWLALHMGVLLAFVLVAWVLCERALTKRLVT
jgi:lipooligosaccharide transport system permease protein